jgi:hypothetical protein
LCSDAYGDKTRQVLEYAMLWNGQYWHNNKEIPGELGTIQKKEQRMPAHQTFLLRPYPLMLLHKNNRQILVHRIWYFVKTLQVSTVLAFMATIRQGLAPAMP